MHKPMSYVRLGNSGLKVSRLILGCASYGDREWADWVLGEEEGINHIKAAYDLGINTFDTANIYSNGTSERILGKAIKEHNLPRDEIVVMTKVWGTVGRDKNVNVSGISPDELIRQRYVNQQGLSRKHIFESIQHSLDRLQLDYVDVLLCHHFDPETPIEETMQALHDVVKLGKARYIGMSSCSAWQFHKMQNYAITHSLTPFAVMQNLYNAVYREEEREMMPLLADLGVGCTPWSPLSRGFLTRSAGTITERSTSDIRYKHISGDIEREPFLGVILERIQTIAEARGIPMAQVGLAWLLSKDFITAPIIGASSIEKLGQLIGSVHVKLTKEEVGSIDQPYQPRAVRS